MREAGLTHSFQSIVGCMWMDLPFLFISPIRRTGRFKQHMCSAEVIWWCFVEMAHSRLWAGINQAEFKQHASLLAKESWTKSPTGLVISLHHIWTVHRIFSLSTQGLSFHNSISTGGGCGRINVCNKTHTASQLAVVVMCLNGFSDLVGRKQYCSEKTFPTCPQSASPWQHRRTSQKHLRRSTVMHLAEIRFYYYSCILQ